MIHAIGSGLLDVLRWSLDALSSSLVQIGVSALVSWSQAG